MIKRTEKLPKKRGEKMAKTSKGNDPHWIEHAHLEKGTYRKATGTPAGKNIPASKITSDIKKGGTIGKQAVTARTLKNLPHKGKGK